MLVVDTEEEFQWGAPFDRRADSVTAMREVGRFQSVCDDLGVRPCYVIDYPVAARAEAISQLRGIVESDRCEIGAHLHPWVNPPLTEELGPRNSYPGNLPAALERAKLGALRDQIQESFGSAPITYKAGRYGIGPNTPGILDELGFLIDLSPAPGFSYVRDGGPDFTHHPATPHRFGHNNRLLCLPTTGGFTGSLPPTVAAKAFELGEHAPFRNLRWRGILSRLNLARQGRLSPEGYSLTDNKALTSTLLARGVNVLTYSFHSPTLKPGCTSYTSSAAEVDSFLGQIREYIQYFLKTVGGCVLLPREVRELLLAHDTTLAA